ncbi:MAG: GGDEF domain-containing protein [Firmicutes bacterium]|nr:GGDEF domain-containing protein [Bacillota bacterium]
MKEHKFSEEQFNMLESLPVPLAVYQFLDKRVVVRALSAGFCELFGFENRGEAYEVMSTDIYSTAHPDDASRIADAAYRFAMEEAPFEVVYRVRAGKEAAYRIVHARGEHVYLKDGTRLAYVWYTDEGNYTGEDDTQKEALRDVFRSALREESMIKANYYDNLTGLPSMSYFFELVEAGRKELRRQGKTPAVLFFDLSGMKYFNQKYGFAQGDQLLREVAGVLSRHFSSQNCSRFGQDHFAVLTDAERLEERLGDVISDYSLVNECQNLPVRIGIYLDEEEGVDSDRACDRAKYACDSIGDAYTSSYTYFSEDMLQEAENRQYIINNLQRALKEQWIQVYYQPIVRTASGKVCNEEALARWVDPELGLLSPAEFIPALEDARQIYMLDLYVVEQVLEKMKGQASEGLYVVPISVNLSRVDFETSDIVEEIRRRVDAAGVEREKLVIEITESTLGSNFEFMKEQIERFQSLGFQVWMDDFGSGYSSLDLLQNIHFDLIKFDMQFMRNFDEHPEGRVILTELVRMAIGLGTDSLCEGVETIEQMDFLREIGCTKLQGYYFCCPIPMEKILERYRRGRQIGFENPEERAYFTALGRINLYDPSFIATESQEPLKNYFNTVPMAVYESTAEMCEMIRCNESYREFMKRLFGLDDFARGVIYADVKDGVGSGFIQAIRQCGQNGNQIIIDEPMPDNTTVHALIKRIAVNPVRHTSALAVVVLGILENSTENIGLSYAQVANALSSDYFDLFYVDLVTEDFNQYSSNQQHGGLDVERNGKDFFRAAREDALTMLYEEDREYFNRSFTKKNVIHALDTRGTFTLTYRLLMDGQPIYVNMKAVRMKGDDRHIIIGVNNVNAQMQEKKALEQIEEERATFARISALAGNFIAIYTVDPATDRYTEYRSSTDFKELGIPKSGEDFFNTSRRNTEKIVFLEDRDYVMDRFTKDKIMQAIARDGFFELQYRLMIDGRPQRVRLRAAMVKEKTGPQLIIGMNNIDARVEQGAAEMPRH